MNHIKVIIAFAILLAITGVVSATPDFKFAVSINLEETALIIKEGSS